MHYHVIESVKDGAGAGLELPTASHGFFLAELRASGDGSCSSLMVVLAGHGGAQKRAGKGINNISRLQQGTVSD